jgi:hypothetical protein
VYTLRVVADRAELTRVAVRDVGSRELKDLDNALALILDKLEPDERVLGAVAGDWFNNRRCVAVATSRKLAVADSTRIEEFPYPSMTSVEYGESWRKGNLLVRGVGRVADIRRVHLDRARSLHSLIQTARTNLLVRKPILGTNGESRRLKACPPGGGWGKSVGLYFLARPNPPGAQTE